MDRAFCAVNYPIIVNFRSDRSITNSESEDILDTDPNFFDRKYNRHSVPPLSHLWVQ